MVRHAVAFVEREVGQALHFAVLLRVDLEERELPFGREIALSLVRFVASQAFGGCHHVRFDRHHDLLVQWRPEVLLAHARHFGGMMEEDL